MGSYRDARHVAGCLTDLCLRALRVLRGSNLDFLCALRVSVVSKYGRWNKKHSGLHYHLVTFLTRAKADFSGLKLSS